MGVLAREKLAVTPTSDGYAHHSWPRPLFSEWYTPCTVTDQIQGITRLRFDRAFKRVHRNAFMITERVHRHLKRVHCYFEMRSALF